MTETSFDDRIKALSFYGEPSYVRVSDLTIDNRYQRNLNIRRVRRMAEEFDPMAVGMLLVSHRVDGTKVVLDGQHRRAMFVQMCWEDQLVPAFVYRNLTLEDEAKIFRITNEERVRPTVVDLFKTKVVEGDPVAIDINGILLSRGLRAGFGMEKGIFRAVSSAQRIYVAGGRTALTNTLDIVRNAWPAQNDPAAICGDMLLGVATVLAEYEKEIDFSRLVRQLSKDTATAILGRAKSARAVIGGELAGNIAIQVVTAYNKSLRSGKLEEFQKRPFRRNQLTPRSAE